MSDIKPVEWSAVVAGRWNPAILTPKGIAELIFEKPSPTTLEVLVAIDVKAPAKVKLDEFIVTSDYTRLIIECEKPDWDSIEKAKGYCCKAIDALPKTPMEAAGFNIRYELKDPDDNFLNVLESPLNSNLSDDGFEIVKRESKRSLSWHDGVINVELLKLDSSGYRINLNFHMSSTDITVLKNWFNINTEDLKEVTKKIITSSLKIDMEANI